MRNAHGSGEYVVSYITIYYRMQNTEYMNMYGTESNHRMHFDNTDKTIINHAIN